MANRLIYFKIIKQIHLISSVILLTFVFIYLITGIVVVNHNLFAPAATEVTHTKALVEKKMTGSAEEYSDYLKERFGFKGRELQRQEKNGNYIFQFNFRGKNHQVTLTPAQDTLYIQTNSQKMTLLSAATKIHNMRGFTGGWEYTLWAVFYDLSAISFVVFAITGILMWLKIRRRYSNGWWYLFAGFLIPIIMIFLFLLWR